MTKKIDSKTYIEHAEHVYLGDLENQKHEERNPLRVSETQNLELPHEINDQTIQTNEIPGPLIIFFGPRAVGKTTTIVRLLDFLGKYYIEADNRFRSDSEYRNTIIAFEQMRRNITFAPHRTGRMDVLLLNVIYQGNVFCQFLEAPGEHYFDRDVPNKEYPAYLSKILDSDYRKIFIFFFEPNMFNSDHHRKNYAIKIARLVREKLSVSRDHAIIVSSKCDLEPYFKYGKPITREFRKALYNQQAFRVLADALMIGNSFGRVPFVPFCSGNYLDEGTGNIVFTPSPDHYPKKLWEEIYRGVRGKWWRKFL